MKNGATRTAAPCSFQIRDFNTRLSLLGHSPPVAEKSTWTSNFHHESNFFYQIFTLWYNLIFGNGLVTTFSKTLIKNDFYLPLWRKT